MATKFKCNDGIYTVLRNGKAVAIGATAGEAITAISDDAGELACCSIEVTGIVMLEGSTHFVVNADGSSLNLCWDNDGGANTGCAGIKANGGMIAAGDGAMYLGSVDGTEYTFYVSNDNGLTYCDSVVINNYTREVTVPAEGAPTAAAVPAGAPACAGTTLYVDLLAFNLTGVTLNTSTGEVTIPAQVVDPEGVYYYYKLCDGLVTAILAIIVTQTLP